ncbi:MAG: glycosyltransferase family 2 protein [Acidobacteria bacterium]|nr:glycosyltransferase family 2 protein [Acidobacteriota bacterium]
MKKNIFPKISIIVDTFNHENFINKAVDSALSQELDISKFEIIVINDGSSDQTLKNLESYGDRVHVLSKKNEGQGSAFNLGLREARGEFVAFLDGDDWWHPNKLQKVLNVLESDSRIGFVGHGIVETDGEKDLRVLAPSSLVRFRLDSRDGARALISHRAFMGTSRMAGRTRLFRELLPVPEALTIEADEYFFTLLPALVDAVILPEALCYYRLHPGNLYQFHGKDPQRQKRKVMAHECLATSIPAKLDEFDVPLEAKELIIESVRMEAHRLRIMVGGGPPGSAYSAERWAFRERQATGERIGILFRGVVLAMAACLPAKWFYRLRELWGRIAGQAS